MESLVQTSDRHQPSAKPSWRFWLACCAIIGLAIAIRVSLYAPKLEGAHTFRQTQTASVAQRFVEGKGTFMHPEMHVGRPGDPLLLEVPLYQFVAAGFCKATGGYAEWKLRALSSLLGAATGFALAMLAWSLTREETTALLALAFYLGAVLPGVFQTMPMPDNLILCIVAFALAGWAAAANGSNAGLFAGTVCSALALTLKLPLTIGLYAASLVLAVKIGRKGLAFWFASGVLGVAGILAWSVYAKAETGSTYFAFVFDPKFSWEWNFGWEKLTRPRFYSLLPLRALQQSCFLSLPFAALALFRKGPLWLFAVAWGAAELAASFLFANLNYTHNYYQLRYALCIAVLASVGFHDLSGHLSERALRRLRLLLFSGAFLCLFLPLLMAHRHLAIDASVAQIQKAATASSEAPRSPVDGLIRNYTWDPSFAYYTDRQLFPIVQMKVGSWKYDNLRAFEELRPMRIFSVGNPWHAELNETEADPAFVEAVKSFVEAHYRITYESKELTIFERAEPPATPR